MHQISFWFFPRGITPERELTPTRKKKTSTIFPRGIHIWNFKNLACMVFDELPHGRTTLNQYAPATSSSKLGHKKKKKFRHPDPLLNWGWNWKQDWFFRPCPAVWKKRKKSYRPTQPTEYFKNGLSGMWLQKVFTHGVLSSSSYYLQTSIPLGISKLP